jgi:hypothetical protein
MNTIGENIYNNLDLLPEDLQGWNSYHPIFRQLIRQTEPKVIIEVGTWKGASAINMARICKTLGLQTKIYCIDTWLGALEFWHGEHNTKERDLLLKNGYPQIYYQFISNVVHNGVEDFIIPVPNTSLNGARLLNAIQIKAELIYIDGSHEYEDVKADIAAYKELCTGIMFGDDYNWPFVKQAVNEILPINTIENYWIWYK